MRATMSIYSNVVYHARSVHREAYRWARVICEKLLVWLEGKTGDIKDVQV